MENSMSEEELRSLASEYDMFDRLCQTVSSPGIDERVIQASILQIVGGSSRDLGVGNPIRGEIHLSVVTDTRVNISRYTTVLTDLIPSSVRLNGTSTTLAGAIGSVSSEGLSPGPLLDPETPLTTIEQVDSMRTKCSSAIEQILDAREYSFGMSNFQGTVSAPGAVFLTANAKYECIDKYEPIASQITIPQLLVQSVDLVLVNQANPTLYDRRGEELSREVAQEYVELVREQRPEFTSEAQDLLLSQIKQYKDGISEALQDLPIGWSLQRALETLLRLSEAHARSNLETKVTNENAEFAVDLYLEILESQGIQIDPEEFDPDPIESEESESHCDGELLKKSISDLESVSSNGAPLDQVRAAGGEFGWSQEKTDVVIDKLKQKGEVYEPSTDILRTM